MQKRSLIVPNVALSALLLLANRLPATAAQLQTSTANLSLGGRQVVAWYPNDVNRPIPLVIFSHGYGGANIQSITLMRSIAGAGYLVLAPNHRDSATWLGGEGKSRPQAGFGDPGGWTDNTYRDRFDDILAVYRAIPNEPRIAALYKGGPVVLAGHSLGGYTALGMAGARPGWSSDIKPVAVLALSPYCAPYLRNGALSGLKAPVMYQGGTLDLGISPLVSQPHGAYEQTPTPKELIIFEGAGHLAWTELAPQHQSQIAEYAVAFCDRHAKGEKPEVLERKLSQVFEKRSSTP